MTPPRHSAVVTTERLEARRLLAAQFIGDLNTAPADSHPSHFTRVGDAVYFFATDAAGRELWKTDGTPTGTARVVDLNPGPGDAVSVRPAGFEFYQSEEIAASGGKVFFTAQSDDSTGAELFVTDGTAAGTRIVRDIGPSGSSDPRGLTDIGGQLFFVANDGTGDGVWKTDGTEAGTVRLGTFRGVMSDAQRRPVASGGLYYFVVDAGNNIKDLWRTDGTVAGTRVVRNRMAPAFLTDVNGTLYFYADDMPNQAGHGLWKTDGTDAGTSLVTRGVQIHPLTMYRPAVAGGYLYFPKAGVPWRTDGTQEGTAEVRSSSLATSINNAVNLFAAGDRVYFSRSSGGLTELWTSDGTPDGTVRVGTDFLPGSFVPPIADFAAVGDQLFFTVGSPTVPQWLWTSDGTAAGTVRIAGPLPPKGSSVPEMGVGGLNGAYLFSGRDDETGSELWQTNGTTAGTSRLKDLHSATQPLEMGRSATRGDALYFSPTNGAHAGDVLKVDGASGAVVVLREGSGKAARGADWFTTLGDVVYFINFDPGHPAGLWRTDGTPAGTVRVLNIGAVSELMAAGGRLYFQFDSFELWTTDGTVAGTRRLGDYDAVWATEGATLGDALYYTANAPGVGYELHRTDGTAEGTRLVADLAGPPIGAAPRSITPVGDALVFTIVSAGAGGRPDQVWRTDGAPEGTVPLTAAGLQLPFNEGRLGLLGDDAYFASEDPAGPALWKTDGTAGGTAIVTRLPAGFSAPDQFVASDGLLYFRAADAQSHSWLWRTDGTASGTLPVRRFDTHQVQRIDLIGEVGGALYLAAEDGDVGRELWRSDGTEAGTGPVTDIFPGPYGSYPQQVEIAGGGLYFTALDPAHGRELWRYTPDAPAIAEVYVRGSTWAGDDGAATVTFKEFMQSSGVGHVAYGYKLVAGAPTNSDTVSWTNVDQIVIRYARPPVSDAGVPTAGTVVVDGTRQDYTVTQLIPIDDRTFALQLDRPLGSSPGGGVDGDRVRLTIPGAGPGGGNFVQVINVLQGDASRDALGRVNAADQGYVKARVNRTSNAPGTPPQALYTVFADVNADGRVNAADQGAVKSRINDGMPATTPTGNFSSKRIADLVLA